MRNIWTEYLTIKGGDFPAWWASLSEEEREELIKIKAKKCEK